MSPLACGIGLFDVSEADLEGTLKGSDEALYRAKLEVRNKVCQA